MSLLKKYGAFFNPKLILRGRYVPKLVQKAAYRCAVLLKGICQYPLDKSKTIVGVHYFVRGGFVGYRSRASSKHLSPHLPVGSLDSSGGQTGDEAHFWLNGYVNKQNCRIWSEANPQVYVETPLHPEKLTVQCALWAGGILLQKR
ncbi:hypothetical protein TNCV_2632811 [Trichonephila clavipes]|nr:hypothetical protein TNCV_2632811 [Trichonephila clavipes]